MLLALSVTCFISLKTRLWILIEQIYQSTSSYQELLRMMYSQIPELLEPQSLTELCFLSKHTRLEVTKVSPK